MPVMNQPIEALTIKDHKHLSIALRKNYLGIKNSLKLSSLTDDQEVKNLLESIEGMHTKHYEKILAELKDYEN